MKILIAEDDNFYSRYLEYVIKLTGNHIVEKCSDSKGLFKAIDSETSVLLLDYNLDEQSGDYTFKRVKKEYPNTEVVIVSGQKDIEIALQLLEHGAFEYIVKNDEAKKRIIYTLNKLSKQSELKKQVDNLQKEVSKKYAFQKMLISNDSSFEVVYQLIQKASKSNINVSIYGKTGTGKELVAKCVHYNSDRNKEPFIAVNLSSLSESLIESELFGYEKGAFTGAHERRVGWIEKANGGTLFLDEISEVSLAIQVKLLRVIQEREIMRIGSSTPIPINCRIICASNKLLSKEVANGNFRQDLYYRIIGLPIELPELRHRGNDMIVLAKYFADEYSKLNNTSSYIFSDSALIKLKKYSFPGNVRELKSIVDLACVLCDDNLIDAEHIVYDQGNTELSFIDSDLTLKDITDNIIHAMLARHNNNVRLVARKLQIGKSTIYRLLQDNDKIE